MEAADYYMKSYVLNKGEIMIKDWKRQTSGKIRLIVKAIAESIQ